MENELAKTEGSSLAKFRSLLSQDVIKKKFEEALGKKAPMFVSNLTTIMSGSAELQKCEHMSVISSALMAASMDLPLTPGLGFAGIVPYWDTPSQSMKAQFQVMKKGFIQLAQRTGLFKIINVSEVFEGELKSHNKFTGEYIFDEGGKKSDNVIGYVSYFRLINGFEKYYYMPIEKLDTHARRYSKSFQRGKGKWADKEEGGYEQMCEKTVLKLNLSTYAPLSVDINMMNAIVYDQAEIRDVEARDYDYVDNEDSRKPDDKEVIDTGGGKQIVINKADAAKSEDKTSRAVGKINPDKFADNKNVTDAVIVPDINQAPEGKVLLNKPENKEEAPFVAEKGSVGYMEGKIVMIDGKPVDDSPVHENQWTLKQMEEMDTKILLAKVNSDMDMMEAAEMIPGKNTNKKLREIIDAWQRNDLTAYVAPYMKEGAQGPGDDQGSADDEQAKLAGEIPTNKSFDKTPEQKEKEIDNFLNPAPKQNGGVSIVNKYGIEIPEVELGKAREFSSVKALFNQLLKVSPVLDNAKYTELATKMGYIQLYPDRETFLRNAPAKEINLLLNQN